MDNVPRYKGYLVRIPKGWGGVALESARKESMRMGGSPHSHHGFLRGESVDSEYEYLHGVSGPQHRWHVL